MADVETTSPEAGSNLSADRSLPIEKIHPNADQPRRAFDEAALEDLTASISQKGVLQPLIVRPHPSKTGEYQIVAGERRWRAAQRANLHELPVLVREFTDTEVMEVAIIENVQRADLNPVEEAAGYKMLMETFGHTQDQVAKALGKSRSHIANLLRLLTLPDALQAFVRDGSLSMGHARALLTAEDPHGLASQVIKKGLSVRETERLAKGVETKTTTGSKTKAPAKDADTRALEGDLSAHLGMAVSINHKPGGEGGTITLSYRDLDQLDSLCRLLSGDT
ncbi:ParB/RepB/Spo0J family partition protein [Primorskyibacter sp. S187A]|uniref:ParB/RepB/Spo0J family partition protein n=1 Tax=Primorskyibacter sp. S187A TaxID=3415130 RepID=UPI003C7C62D8